MVKNGFEILRDPCIFSNKSNISLLTNVSRYSAADAKRFYLNKKEK